MLNGVDRGTFVWLCMIHILVYTYIMTTLTTTPRVDRSTSSVKLTAHLWTFKNLFWCSNWVCSKHNFCLLPCSLSGGSWNTCSLLRMTSTAEPTYWFMLIFCSCVCGLYMHIQHRLYFINLVFCIPQFDWFIHNKHEISICLRVRDDTRKWMSSSQFFWLV